MPGGREMMHRLQEALTAFEEAIKRREHRKPLESKFPLQQDVDHAREHVVEVVVELVREARESAGAER